MTPGNYFRKYMVKKKRNTVQQLGYIEGIARYGGKVETVCEEDAMRLQF